MILFADAGIPMLAVVWPFMWLAFLPVVVIESIVALKSLGIPFRRAFLVTAAANAVSTLAGIPVTWFVLAAIEMTITDGRWQPIDTPMQAALAVFQQAAWLCPYEGALDWMIPAAALVLCIPFFFVSVWIEYLVVRRLVANGRQVLRFCWWANFWSYLGIVVFWASCFWTANPSFPFTPEEVAAIADIRSVGGGVYRCHESSDRSAIVVNLSRSQATDADLDRLPSLTNRLESLVLNSNITDAGMEHISGLTSLRELCLSETQATDASLKYLKGLTALRSLDLRKTQLTDEGVKELQEALPNCKIER
jgi:hypothetical protein